MAQRTILVVDPDPLQRQLVDVLLADPNARLLEAASAREALELLKEHTPDLVLVAFELPDLDGAEVTDRIKRVSRLARVPVVLTTAMRDGLGVAPVVRAKARSAGVDLLIPKPLGDKNVRERVRRLMAEPQHSGGTPPGTRERSTLVLDETLVTLDEVGGVVPSGTALHGAGMVDSSTTPGGGGEADQRQELERLRSENDRLRKRVEALERERDAQRGDDRSGRRRGARGRANGS